MRRLLLFSLALCLLPVRPLSAHGGGEIQLADVPVGPYKLIVWLNPPAPRADQTLHVTVGLSRPPENAPVLDATVQVQVVSVHSPEIILSTAATTANSSNKLFYETDFRLTQPDAYRIYLLVDGPLGGGTADFPLTLAPPSPINWTYVGLGGLLVIMLLAIVRQRRETAVD